MTDESARMLGDRYQIGDVIGRGGMAEVHEGRDLRLGRRIAVKILRPDLARDPSFQARFRREAQSAAALNHPNIVAVYDTGEDTLAATDTSRAYDLAMDEDGNIVAAGYYTNAIGEGEYRAVAKVDAHLNFITTQP